jgi:hypothetical protein
VGRVASSVFANILYDHMIQLGAKCHIFSVHAKKSRIRSSEESIRGPEQQRSTRCRKVGFLWRGEGRMQHENCVESDRVACSDKVAKLVVVDGQGDPVIRYCPGRRSFGK